MAVLPPFSKTHFISPGIMGHKTNLTGGAVLFLCTFAFFCLQITSTANTNDCRLIGAGACRGKDWDKDEWPILLEGAKSLSECCNECNKKKGCTSFHLGKLKHCFLFAHTAIVPVKSMGGECYEIAKGKAKNSNDDDNEGPTEEECKKYVNMACKGETKNKETPHHHKSKDSGKDSKEEKDVEPRIGKSKDEILKKQDANRDKKEAPRDETKLNKQDDAKPTKDKKKKDDDKKEKKKDHIDKKDEKSKDAKELKPKIAKEMDVDSKPAPKQSANEAKPTKTAQQKGSKVEEKAPKAQAGQSQKPTGTVIKEQETKKKEDPAPATKISKGRGGEAKNMGKGSESHKPKTQVPEVKAKKTKKVDTGPKKYEGKYLSEIGKGGCRGKNWNKKNCPKSLGRKTLDGCAMECRTSDFCTAFHILNADKDQTFDCLLFSHNDVIAVKGLGGVCYTFSENPPGKVDEEEAGIDDIDEEEDDVGHTGPVIPLLLGDGLCRGPKWTFKAWPVVRGRLSNQHCADECAKRKGCTAYDISMEYKDKYDCVLYGHKAVVPAIGVSKLPAKCYVLKGSPLANLLDEEDIITPGQEDEMDEDEDEDEDIGEVDFSLVGKGMCRGPKWQSQNWPKSKGIKTITQCATACLKKEGCRSFDMSPPDSRYHDVDGRDKMWCNLYSNKDTKPASGVPGNCYKIQKDSSELSNIPEDDEMVIDDDVISAQEVDDSLLNSIPKEGKDFKNLGKGMCRGPNWQDEKNIWPKDDGKETFEDCLKECRNDKGCTAFDVSPIANSIKFHCLLYGHEDVRPASSASLSGRCIRMTGRRSLPTIVQNVLDGGDGFVSLGKGLCRGPNWQIYRGKWPMDKEMKTIKECYTECKNTGGCTSFDIRDPDGKKKYHCFLFGHANVIPATALPGTCYKMTGPVAPLSLDDDQSSEPDSYGLSKIGEGACRGPGWQGISSKWPLEIGQTTVSECGDSCATTEGCTAFDVRLPTGVNADTKTSQFICTLYGHSNVLAASAVAADCYAPPRDGFINTPYKKKEQAQDKPTVPKTYKIPKFKEPKVLHDEQIVSDDDDEWLFEPPPPEIRSRDHIQHILDLEAPLRTKMQDKHLKEIKKIYEKSIKPLETTYKYKELSNRHFGDPEIFNNPLIVLMGPWSGGKSTMINYFLGTEYTKNAFRAAAEPSPGFNFNIAMYGEQDEDLDGTELAAEWTFSSLQKFGQEFLKKLRGKKISNNLLKRATFAEIPGVLETGTKRKVDRLYPFNEACQWFIDHADLILLVYDYTKLDIGPETEALLDQLKGRESQVRIILNKADEITAEELLKIQGNLVWNVSPLMSSLEPPTMYAGSFWSRPYKEGAPKKLLKAQETSLLKDIREAIDKRVENRIATARRFAVRVRNHAKMVDCYLTTFNNKKGMFGNKKTIMNDIVENPEKFHIYEGISSMTNISRYDLPDPDTYRTFFGLHPLSEFQTLQSTCTYFKGCPINKLDMAISYELPDALTAYKREVKGIASTEKANSKAK